jgi:subtilisin-like proprotein convertase family protein
MPRRPGYPCAPTLARSHETMRLHSFARFFRTVLGRRARRRRRLERGRRLAVRALEERTLMSTTSAVPPALVNSPGNFGNGISPQVLIDPVHPTQVLEVDSTGTAPEVRVNTGSGWNTVATIAARTDPVASTTSTVPFAQVTNPSIAFDRTDSFYIVALEHNAAFTSGAVVLNKFSFAGGTVTQQINNEVLYAWDGQDPAFNPVVAVDNNLPTFTDPATGKVQTDTLATLVPGPGGVGLVPKALFVAWNTNVTLPKNSTPATVSRLMVAVSDDGGQSFTAVEPLRTPDTTNVSAPKLMFTQGTANGNLAGGQLLTFYDEQRTANATDPNGKFFDLIASSISQPDGGVASQGAGVAQVIAGGTGSIPDNGTGTYSAVVKITDLRFTTVSDLSVTLDLTHPNLSDISVVLNPPTGSGLAPITLVSHATGSTLGGANLGMVNGFNVGTVFDESAARSILDGTVGSPYIGTFRSPSGGLTEVRGLSAAAVAGAWTLTITDFSADFMPPTQSVSAWSLDFTSRLAPDGSSFGSERQITSLAHFPYPVGSAATPVAVPVQGAINNVYPLVTIASGPNGIGPGISVAVDNTLGSFSPYQGRVYLAYTGTGATFDTNKDTNIYLLTSDDGGASWSNPVQVNDDNPAVDGFSEGDRPQFMPAVAVDPVTGTLVVDYYDGRYDPSMVRVANFLSSSIDGGQHFSQSVFLNESSGAIDTISGKVQVIEPIPGNEPQAAPFGFGDRQGLAVYGGVVYPFFASNANTAPTSSTDIDSQVMSATVRIAAGPRILQGDMGPVTATQTAGSFTYNNTFATDGTRQLTGFVVTFDRPVDPATFTPGDVTVLYHSPTTPAGSPGIPITVTGVVPVDGNQVFGPDGVGGNNTLATTFLVQLAAASGVGTYSYVIGPAIFDSIRTVNPDGTVNPGTAMDENANANPGETPGDQFAIPRPLRGVPFQLPYDPTTLPLIIPGPHVVQTAVPGQQPTPDNLVLNGTASAINVVFDRDINPTSFTPGEILTLIGPAGPISGPFTVTADPLHVGDKRTFRIGFPTQTLSGTYTLTLGTDIQDTNGDKVDNNLNAGLFVLRGADPSNAAVVVNSYNQNTPLTIGPGQTVTSTLTVNDVFPIVQDANAHIQLRLDASFPNDPDLSGVLIAPEGTTIPLFTGVGTLGAPPQSDFKNTTFDDFANAPIQLASPPFDVGPFNPQKPLSALIGLGSNGTWTLSITNAGGHTGTLNSWTLKLPQSVPGTGLGEPVADQTPVSFRIFTQDPSNAQSSTQWTAVGPAANNNGFNSGRVTGLAVDPSDPSGNTVYVGAASGGVWKTTDFLTTSPNGPTWVPLTDLGPTYSLNIGSIAIFGRNHDPNQSVIFAATGEGDSGTPGVGVLRSMDGGRTWQVLDSSVNVDSAGNILAMGSPSRDHMFLGTTSFKIVVDPNPLPNGQIAVYLAVSGPNGGLYRSADSGNTWQLIRKGQATDVVLAAGSAGANGNLELLYAGFQGEGVFFTSSALQATSMTQLVGGQGVNIRRNIDSGVDVPIPVVNPPDTPNGAKGRIVLATPALANNPLADTLYQGWLYAAVANTDGTLNGLYMTKDFGNNWTKVLLPVYTPTTDTGFPSNDPLKPSYDVIDHNNNQHGNYDIALAVDPTNPDVVYLGGTANEAPTPAGGVIRVDTSLLSDVYSMVAFSQSNNDGGLVGVKTTGSVSLNNTSTLYGIIDPFNALAQPRAPYLDMLRDPDNPFIVPTSMHISDVSQFNNQGTGARWTPFNDFVTESTNDHRFIAIPDPLTGGTRLIVTDDQGIFTGVDAGTGALLGNLGTAGVVTGPRSGNLQITQFISGAVQPSTLAAQLAGALFYGQAKDDAFPESAGDSIFTGNLNWDAIAGDIAKGDGTGVATDPTGSGLSYQYRFPLNINHSIPLTPTQFLSTDFFSIVPPGGQLISRTSGLIQSGDNPSAGAGQWPPEHGDVQVGDMLTPPVGMFAVNPFDPTAIVISSAAGRIFRTSGPLTGTGIQWFVIGNPTDLDGTYAPALAFGAPNPSVPNVLDDFIYAGTTGGHVFVTFSGGGFNGSTQWKNISAGLDGSPVQQIVTDPKRGTHDAFAVTEKGVYFMADSSAANPVWVKLNDTAGQGTLFGLTRGVFNNSTDPFPTLQYLTTIAVDWRFAIPDKTGTGTHPVLYVGGDGGVFRSLDKGLTWTYYPDIAQDGATQEGGYLPNVHVTHLDIALGNFNTATGFPDASTGLNLLVATTYGRGTFAIRMDNHAIQQFAVAPMAGPFVTSMTPTLTNHGTTVTAFTLTFNDTIDPETVLMAAIQSLTGPSGAITPFTFQDVTPTPAPGQPNPHNDWEITFAPQTTAGAYTLVLGPGITDLSGDQMDQDQDGVNGIIPEDQFSGTFNFVPNRPPTITGIPNTAVLPGTSTGNLPFTVGDPDTGPGSVTVTGASSNPTLVPTGGIVISGTGANRTVDVTPAAGQHGTAVITLTASDPLGLTTSTSFTLTVDTPPQIGAIPDQFVSHSQLPLSVPVNTTDADGNPVSLQAAVAGYNPAYDVQQQLGLYMNGSFFQNFDGLNEKWLYSAVQNRYFVILPDGEVRPGKTATSATSTLVTLDPRYWQDPTLIFNAPAPTTPATVSVSGGNLLMSAPVGFAGTFRVTVTASDGLMTTAQSFLVHVTDQAPVLQAVQDQTVAHDSGPFTLPLTVSDPDPGDTPQVSATVAGFSPAATLQHQLGLYMNGSFFQNFDGLNEKWLYSAVQNRYFVILPDGEVRPGKTATSVASTFVTLDPRYWQDPTLIFNAPTPAAPPGASAVVSGNSLTVTTPAHYTGTFRVIVTATDGILTTSQSFLVHVTDRAPLLQPVPDQALPPGGPTTVTVAASDPDAGDNVTLGASVAGYSPAYELQQQLGLYMNGSFYQNTDGLNEKWLFSAVQNRWFVILPDGEVRPGSTATNLATTLVTLSKADYLDPTQIFKAAAPVAPTGAGATLSGNTLTVTAPSGFTGAFRVVVTATDGVLTTSQQFLVNVTAGAAGNQAPVLQPVPDQVVTHGSGPLKVNMSASDPDGDPVNVQAVVSLTGPAADLQRQLGLFFNGSFFQNFDGLNEKWLFSAAKQQWYVILPDGEVRPGATATNAATDVATLDSSYWQGPNLLFAPPLPATATVTGGTLTVLPATNFTGTFRVTVAASDGQLMTSQAFLVTVNDQAPEMATIPDKTLPHTQALPPFGVPALDPEGDPLNFQTFVSPVGPAADLQQRLGLYENGSFFQNFDGLNEKWLFSAIQNHYFVILPDGEVRPGASATNAATDMATLDSSYWQDPNLIFAPPLPAVTATVTGGILTVTTPANYAGIFRVGVTAADGILASTGQFVVSVTDHAPVVPAVTDPRMPSSQPSLTVAPAVSDADGDTVNVQAIVAPTGPAAALQQQLGLHFNGSFFQNFDGLNERWLFSAVQQQWYIILPDGEVRPSKTATNPATDVATLDPSFWQNPSLIFAPPLPATVSVSGGAVIVTPQSGFLGSFTVTVIASDGIVESLQRFTVTVTS